VSTNDCVEKHDLNLSAFKSMMASMKSQGYRMNWVTGYAGGGTVPLYGAVWEKATGPDQFVSSAMSASQFATELTNRTNLGYRLALVSGYAPSGTPQFIGLWQKKTGPTVAAKVGMSASAFATELTNRKNGGYHLVHSSGYAVNNVAFYTGVWVKESRPTQIEKHGMSTSTFESQQATNSSSGYRLSAVSSYTINGSTQYAAIWEKVSGLPPWK